jgi:RNA polymerase sigma-70 factor, ECF subfamily
MTGSDADEIVQNVWLAVVKGKRRCVPAVGFVTYLFAIARHSAVEGVQKRGRLPHTALSADGNGDAPDDSPDSMNIARNAELGRPLADAIALLPLVQRKAFLMQAEGRLSLDEMAEVSGASRETVKGRLRYANRKLRRALENRK